MRVIVVEPRQRACVTGDYVAQGGNADPAIGEDGDEHGAEQAAGQPAMRNFSDRPPPGIPAIEDEACHGVVEDHEGHDDEVGEGQLTLVEQTPLDDHVLPRHAASSSAQARHIRRRCRRSPRNRERRRKHWGRRVCPGERSGPRSWRCGQSRRRDGDLGPRCGMNKNQRGRRRRQRGEDERTLGRKERRLRRQGATPRRGR